METPGAAVTTPNASDSPRPHYPGDFTGPFVAEHSPQLDGAPDPGEVVWTWVPYQEDHTRGKDRPVLLIGYDNKWLLGLMLSSSDRSNNPHYRGDDAEDWMDIGSGPWDSKGRPSEIRVDRIIRVDPTTVRREGAIMDRALFDSVVKRVIGTLTTA